MTSDVAVNETVAPGPEEHAEMPAEWAPHERCLMAWPTRRELWGPTWDLARTEYTAVAHAISTFEPVLMVVAPGALQDARDHLGADVELAELAIDDSWLRDSGPIFRTSASGARTGVAFRFNSWGERFKPYDNDATIAGRLLDHLGERREDSPMVLEGGAITVDGEGTLITTEQCLLNANRNPHMTRDQIEDELRARLGVRKIIWLPYGHFDDTHTDGHVDGVCAFTAPGHVVVQACAIPGHPDVERMAANRAVLEASTDADGRPLRITELPYYPAVEVGGSRTVVSYINGYVANGGLVVPTAGHADDPAALELLRDAFGGRETVGVVCRAVAYGGGGIHCITQQVPR
jgi:agmatine deiminase